MIPIVIVCYGLKVTVWILDMANTNLIYSVNVMSWYKYFTHKLPVKPFRFIRTFDKKLNKPLFTKIQYDKIVSLILKSLN